MRNGVGWETLTSSTFPGSPSLLRVARPTQLCPAAWDSVSGHVPKHLTCPSCLPHSPSWEQFLDPRPSMHRSHGHCPSQPERGLEDCGISGTVIGSLDFENAAALDHIWEEGKRQGLDSTELILRITLMDTHTDLSGIYLARPAHPHPSVTASSTVSRNQPVLPPSSLLWVQIFPKTLSVPYHSLLQESGRMITLV